MKIKIISIIVIAVLLTTTITLMPSALADEYHLDPEANQPSQTMWLAWDNSYNDLLQSFKPSYNSLALFGLRLKKTTDWIDCDAVLKIGTTKGGNEKASFPFSTSRVTTNTHGGWNDFESDTNIAFTPDQTYYMTLEILSDINEDTNEYLCWGMDNSDPYSRGSVWNIASGTGTWTESSSQDTTFECYMREQNSPPNPPDLISPISGTTFTITEGETIDVDLTATATDPDGDEMIYRFWDEDNADDSIGTCFDMYSEDEGTITWENLGPGTYRWYAKAADYNSGFSEKSNTNTFTIETEETDEYTLTVNKQGQGTITKNPDKNKYISGKQVTLTANPATGWSFSQWNGDLSSSSNPKTITMDADKSVTAIFSENSNQNNPPDIPTIIDPLTEAYTEVGIQFNTVTTDSENDQIYYKFNWGDGTTSEWIGPCDSGEECYDIHYWNTQDTYNIQVKAKDSHGATSDWSQNYPISITVFDVPPNYPPLKPSTPEGPATGELGKKYSFSTVTIDPENDKMIYFWDMDGDQETIEVTEFISLIGSTVEHTWYKTGTYPIRVIACDQFNGEGTWSEPLFITINPSDEEFIPIKPSISGPNEGYIGEEIFLTTMSYDLNDEDIRYKWDFGDETAYHYTDYIKSGESVTVDHRWADEGTYNVRVKAENINNEVSSWSNLKTINIKHDKTSTTYYPVGDPNHINDRKFSTPKAKKDFFAYGLSLGFLEDIFYKRDNFVDETTGQIGTFS